MISSPVIAGATEGTRPRTARPQPRTIWGMDPVRLHASFWAARGVQVVRQGEPSEIVEHAELFLLLDPRTLAVFRLRELVERISWLKTDLTLVRLIDARDRGYREIVVTDEEDRFVRIRRDYGSSDSRLARVALTPDLAIARVWQSAPSPRAGWQRLRRVIRRGDRWSTRSSGHVYDRTSPHEMTGFVRDLVESWDRPDAVIPNIKQVAPHVWAVPGVHVNGTRFSGPLWIGAGRSLGDAPAAVGPGVLWDNPESRPRASEVRWLDIEPSAAPDFKVTRVRRRRALIAKRTFDILFALAALLFTLPLYPLIALIIYLDNPGPIFFVHKRETRGGRTFGCIKFRSMKKNAETTKKELKAQNKADGPQFFIPDDPRLTRFGRLMRKCQIDELPQFINVLMGDMSVVGPRPIPYEENQFCPPWREARLSVKPGVTGLWQVKRTRAAGTDFQEWIKYDIQYVEEANFRYDLWIVWETIKLVIRGVTRG